MPAPADDDGFGEPICPRCSVPFHAVGVDETAHWYCLGCATLMPSDGLAAGPDRLRRGDLVAERRSSLAWTVSIGGVAGLGAVHRGIGAWIAIRRPDQFDDAGNVYVERGLPVVLGLADSIAAALTLFPAAARTAGAPH